MVSHVFSVTFGFYRQKHTNLDTTAKFYVRPISLILMDPLIKNVQYFTSNSQMTWNFLSQMAVNYKEKTFRIGTMCVILTAPKIA